MILSTNKGFTLIEIVIVIILVGIIGSMAASMLFQGSDIFIQETNRQGFVSESRSAFWRILRETQGQASSADFVQSDQNKIHLKNGKNDQKEFRIESSGDFDIRLGNGNYNSLSNSIVTSNNKGFFFYDNNFSLISPSSSGLSLEQAKDIRITKLDLKFTKDEDNLFLSSFVYPNNFRFGQKMSYHN
tara:strand:- start:489 stop:1049 length:561 start_codon:yes stop_codon:yes gene_type:complete